MDAARIAQELAARRRSATAWGAESACAGMTVGGLAHHLVRQAVADDRAAGRAHRRASRSRCSSTTSRAPGCSGGHDDPANVAVRTGSDERAAGGRRGGAGRGARGAGPSAASCSPDRATPTRCLIPWQGWSLTVDDLVTTRLMEMVVHSDDLAASVDLPTPEFPEPALTPVLGLLSGVAVRRHGQAAVVRALSRPQRAPEHVSAF